MPPAYVRGGRCVSGEVTVNGSGRLSGGERNWGHEATTRSTLSPSVPHRDHQPCRLAVPSVQPQYAAVELILAERGVAVGTVQRSGRSCRFGTGRLGIGDPVKSMPQCSTERAVVDCAANLEQQISTASRPSHLLGLVHAPVDQEIRGTFSDRSPDAQTGAVSFGVVNQPCGLASEIFIDGMQRMPQLAVAQRVPRRNTPALPAMRDSSSVCRPDSRPTNWVIRDKRYYRS
jgi:hypothetical protein